MAKRVSLSGLNASAPRVTTYGAFLIALAIALPAGVILWLVDLVWL